MKKSPSVLIASDNVEDVKVVKQQIMLEAENIHTSTSALTALQDFESHLPDILVLAFNTLEKAEAYYLGLYRLSSMIHAHPHRTILLCSKDEITRVYDLCRKDYFDDYVLFWPMTYDATRLAMAIHHAQRSLAAMNADPAIAQIAAQTRRLAELETLLQKNIANSGERIEHVRSSYGRIEHEIGASLDGFSQRLTTGDIADLVEVKDAQAFQAEITRFKQDAIHTRLHDAEKAVEPLKEWAQKFQLQCAPHLESARVLKTMAEKVPPVILIVDDDPLQQKLLGAILSQEDYTLQYATGGAEALGLLQKRRPDLILMDVMMPDIDGVETTRRLKSVERFADIPVIMVTGNSEKALVAKCLKAGAADFIVKPYQRETLLEKVHKFLY